MVDMLVQGGLEDPRGLEREGGAPEMGERWRGNGVAGSTASPGQETKARIRISCMSCRRFTSAFNVNYFSGFDQRR